MNPTVHEASSEVRSRAMKALGQRPADIARPHGQFRCPKAVTGESAQPPTAGYFIQRGLLPGRGYEQIGPPRLACGNRQRPPHLRQEPTI